MVKLKTANEYLQDPATVLQYDLEEAYCKYQTIPAVREDMISSGLDADLKKDKIDVDFGLDALVQIALHRRTTVDTMVGILWKHFDDSLDPFQKCADELERMVDLDYMDWDPDDGEEGRLIVNWEIDDAVQAKIDMFQYPLPMIHRPNPITDNWCSGYNTFGKSVILKDNHHDKDVCLDHLNRANSIPLKLNEGVLSFVLNSWKKLSKRKEDEEYDDYLDRVKAFMRYNDIAYKMIDTIVSASDRFWLTHRYDKRGRTYSQGYHLNYQGNDWNKACIEFADPEPLNAE